MKKRLLSSLLSLAMVLTLLPVTALAAGEGDTPQEPTSTTEDAIAQITVGDRTTKYSDEDSFEAAAETLTNAAIVKLLQDVEINGSETADKRLVFPAGSNITLDLNGKTLTVGQRIEVKGDLTVDGNGTIASVSTSSTSYYAVFYVSADGKLALKSGTVNAAEGGYTLNVLSGATASVEGGILKGKINASVGTLKITGGQFATDISPYLGAGQGTVQENGYYSVSETSLTAETAVAQIENGEYYASVVGALAAAEDNETVTVLKNATESAGVTYTGTGVMLDLNGFTVDMGGSYLNIKGSLTLTDGKTGGMIKGTTTYVFLVQSNGALTMESGTVQGTKMTIQANTGGIFTMNGGNLITDNDKQLYTVYLNGGSVEILGGRITGSQQGIYVSKGSLTVGKDLAGEQTYEDAQKIYIETIRSFNQNVTLNSGIIGNLVSSKFNADTVLKCWFENDITDYLSNEYMCIQVEDHSNYWKVVGFSAENAVAKITGSNEKEVLLGSLSQASANLESGDTVTLLKDVTSAPAANSGVMTIAVPSVTIDLNGHSITNTNDNGYAIRLRTETGTPNEGGTIKIVNNSSERSVVTAATPLYFSNGGSEHGVISIDLADNIDLVNTSGQSIYLGSDIVMPYSEKAAEQVGIGGFKATKDNTSYIYGYAKDAMEAADDDTVVLLNDYTGKTTIDFGKANGTLDLDGHTYTYTGSAAVINVTDSGADVTITNGTIVSSGIGAEVGLPSGDFVPGNISLTLDDVNLTVNGTEYGVVSNGRCSNINLTLQNGTVLNSPQALGIYWPSGGGTVTIDNSQITAHTGVQICAGGLVVKGDDTVITATGTPIPKTGNDGGISDGAAISIVERDGYKDLGTVTIEAGTFKSSTSSKAIKAYTFNNTDKTEGAWAEANKTISISGGSFSSDPSAYVTEKYIALVENGQYVVKDKGEIEVAVVPAAPSVPAPDTEGMSDDEKKMAGNVQTALTSTTNPISADGLDAVANTVAAATEEKPADYVDELKKLDSVNDHITDKDVTIVVQPYLNVVIDDVTIKDDTKAITLDITPMYRTIATAANLGDSNAEIKVRGDEGVDDSAANAVVINNGGKLNAIGQVEISIPLPDGFVSNTTDKVYVQHKGYEYTADVTESGEESNKTYTATFTNPHGFSTFTISTESQTVATLNGVSYTSLQDALADAEDGDTVKVLKNGLTASMSGSTRTITLANGVAGAEITVTINGVELSIARSGTETYTYTRPSSSGGGSSTPTYTVSKPLDVTGGEISVLPSRAAKNATVTITVKPDEGYELDELIVRDSDGETVELTQKSDTEYTFKMPASKVTVEASFVEIEPVPSELPFTDVAADAWYHDAVAYVYDNGMMNGVTENTFAPNATTTRGMIVTMLHRLEGKPGVNYLLPFGDVPEGLWYTEAVRWAASEGIVNGVSDTSYAPDNAITREQMAAILYRYAQYKGYDTSVGGMSLAEYTDADQISSYATTAMQWANENGLITGRTDTTLVPQGTATRAEVATILMRFCEDIAK